MSDSQAGATHYDLIVIGGGATGSGIVSQANKRGLRVANIEQWKIGGTCVNVGCDPTKALVRTAAIAHFAKNSESYGLDIQPRRPQWQQIHAHYTQIIETMVGSDPDQKVRESGIELYKSHGRFTSPHVVEVDGRSLTADRYVIATGARPMIPNIEGIKDVGYLTNASLLEDMRELPGSMLIVGGGPIAVEFAQILARLGVDVTLIGSAERILPKEESELSDALTQVLRDEGVTIETDVRVNAARLEGEQKVLTGARKSGGGSPEFRGDEVLIATGRQPNVDDLGLDAAGVAYSKKGVEVDATMQTSADRIWAVGDVTGKPPFTHVGSYQVEILMQNFFSDGTQRQADYRAVPWGTFSDPELARVGMTEQEAREAGYDVVAATYDASNIARAIVNRDPVGLVKLVVDRSDGQILGGHILMAEGAELLAEVVLSMQHRLPVSAIANKVPIYPTMSQGVHLAAQQAVRQLDGS